MKMRIMSFSVVGFVCVCGMFEGRKVYLGFSDVCLELGLIHANQ